MNAFGQKVCTASATLFPPVMYAASFGVVSHTVSCECPSLEFSYEYLNDRKASTRCVLGEAQIHDLHEGNVFTGPFFTISGVMKRTMKTAQDTLPTGFFDVVLFPTVDMKNPTKISDWMHRDCGSGWWLFAALPRGTVGRDTCVCLKEHFIFLSPLSNRRDLTSNHRGEKNLQGCVIFL
ncbi:hypothetical protein BDN67DRAFT_701168 [Paxillus ammoniavirescens]|nr:hypothetical protein BDN67DRAFT_701168 [Paxillus ammoniavirescens]